jgi:hypothetical protein
LGIWNWAINSDTREKPAGMVKIQQGVCLALFCRKEVKTLVLYDKIHIFDLEIPN